jgi:hypothetical protein
MGLGYRNILTKLLIEGDAPSATKLTIERDPENAYSFFRYCRRKIVDDDKNRDPKFLQRVRDFQHVHFGPQDPEWQKLDELMGSTLKQQYHNEISTKPFFKNHRPLDAPLRQIKCMPPVFYEYTIPDEITEKAIERDQERREVRHCTAINISNIQTIVSRAQQWRTCAHPWDLVACASILCGRRTQEITWAASFEPVDKYVVWVSGLLKQNVGEGEIPILIDSHEFVELIAKIRENRLPDESTTHRLKPAFMRLFGEWFNHTQRRNIYCEAAYRMRDTSRFHPDYPPIMWFDKALCHDSNVIHQAPSLAYQTLTFHERT